MFHSVQFMLAVQYFFYIRTLVTFFTCFRFYISYKHFNIILIFKFSKIRWNIGSEIGFYDSCSVACSPRIIVTITNGLSWKPCDLLNENCFHNHSNTCIYSLWSLSVFDGIFLIKAPNCKGDFFSLTSKFAILIWIKTIVCLITS